MVQLNFTEKAKVLAIILFFTFHSKLGSTATPPVSAPG